MADEFSPRSGRGATVPPPPRITGNYEVDAVGLRNWMQAFFEVSVVETGLLDPTYQASGGEVDVTGDLPDPQNSTIARAQGTANAAVEALFSRIPAAGTITIADTDDEQSVTFETAMPDETYQVIVTPSDYEGSPAVGAFEVIRVTKATTGFAVLVTAAPGSGTSVSFDYIVIGTIEET